MQVAVSCGVARWALHLIDDVTNPTTAFLSVFGKAKRGLQKLREKTQGLDPMEVLLLSVQVCECVCVLVLVSPHYTTILHRPASWSCRKYSASWSWTRWQSCRLPT